MNGIKILTRNVRVRTWYSCWAPQASFPETTTGHCNFAGRSSGFQGTYSNIKRRRFLAIVPPVVTTTVANTPPVNYILPTSETCAWLFSNIDSYNFPSSSRLHLALFSAPGRLVIIVIIDYTLLAAWKKCGTH